MSLIPIVRDPARWQLMVFAGMGCVALAWAGHATSQTAPAVAYGLWAAAVTLGCVGLARPDWLRQPYVVLSYLFYPVGVVVSLIVLAAVYYFVMTLIGLVLRAAGHDPLHRRRPAGTTTYWSERKMEEDPERYFRPF